MEERHLLGRAPIAAIERVRADQVERACDRHAVPLGEDQQDPVAHRLPDLVEKRSRQIGLAPFAAARVLIEDPERIPVRGRDLGTGEVADRQPLDRGGAFLADRLALAAGERGEEIIEARIALIGPVELSPLADQPPRSLEQWHLGLRDEGRMRGRQPALVGDRLERGDQRGRDRGIAQQQPRSRHRAERRGDLEFRVIAPARPLPGIGPALVEDILALAVALGVGGGDSGGPAVGAIDHNRQ